MKKIIKYLFVIGSLLIPFTNIKAATGVFDIYASSKSVAVGGSTTVTVYCKSEAATRTCEYTLSYDSSKLQFLGANDSVNCNGTYCSYVATTTSSAMSFNFKVVATGNSTVSVVSYGMYDLEENKISVSVDPVSISGYIPSAPSSSSGNSTTQSKPKVYSTNNYLSSLKIDGYTLDKEFNKDTDSYTVTVNPDVLKVNIIATAEDNTAKITGNGEKEVTEGNNKFEIVVTSEKGTTRKYNLDVIVKDQNPIEVKINDKVYTVIKRLNLEKPKTCKEETTTINDIKIPIYTCENTNYTLIGLKDSNSNSNLYIYNEEDNSYILYQELTFPSQTIGILDTDKEIKNYSKMKVLVNDISIIGYKSNALSNYTLFYGINIETGKENWYMYEASEKTIQIYNIEDNELFSKQINNAKMLIYILGGIVIFLAILLIAIATSKTKKKHKTKEIIKEEIKKPITEENKETQKKKKKSKHDIFEEF